MLEKMFLEKLYEVRLWLLENEIEKLRTISADDFEELVATKLSDFGVDHVDWKKGALRVPDIKVLKLGVEVKKTEGKTWEIMGGSIFETTRDKEVEKIWLFVLKKKSPLAIRIEPYDLKKAGIIFDPRLRWKIDLDAESPIKAPIGITKKGLVEHVKKYVEPT